MPVDPATVSYLLSSIASTAKIIEFGLGLSGRRASKAEIDDVAKAADAYGSEKFGLNSAAVIGVNTEKLSNQIVDAIKKQVERSRDKIIHIVNSDYDEYERNKRLKDERRNFCGHIAQIRNFNGGKLPPDLEEEWTQICSDYVPL